MKANSLEELLSVLLAIFFALTVHEYAHAKIADMSGDPTPRYYDRVTLNPLKHIDPLGAFMIIFTTLSGFGIGWGKPVPMDPRKMKNPKWDHFWAVAAGPISSFAQAALYALILRTQITQGIPFLFHFAEYGMIINLGICFFNLIPLGPLDGHHLVHAFLPKKIGQKWYLWNRQKGSLILLMFIILGQLNPSFSIINMILAPCVTEALKFLIGI